MNDRKHRIVISSHAEGGVNYKHIFDAIVEAICSGSLAPGEKLPPQRELAKHFGVAPGTVSRAYSEAARRRFVTASVGRGTFVAPPEDRVVAIPSPSTENDINFSINRPPPNVVEQVFSETLQEIARSPNLINLLGDQPSSGARRYREAAVRFLSPLGLQVTANEVIICNGVQHGLASVLSSIAKPGDVILTEALNYHGIYLLEQLYGLRLVAVDMDSEGIRPDMLEAACKRENPRFLFLTPTLHNPTTRSMSESRRRAIADLVKRHDLILIEDDIYGRLPEEPRLPISALIRNRSFYLTGMSKCLTTGLRIGYIVTPRDSFRKLSATVQATVWIASSIMAEIVTRWTDNGIADEVISLHRKESRRRNMLARQIFPSVKMECDDINYTIWVHLPEPWRQEEFTAEARTRGVLVAPGEAFVIGRRPAPHAVRISLGTIIDEAELKRGLTILSQLLAERPALSPSAI